MSDNDTTVSGHCWRPDLGVPTLTVLAAVFIVAVDNATFWQHLLQAAPLTSIGSAGFVIAVAVFLVAALSFLMSLFAVRFVYKPFVIVLLMLASVIAYFMGTYGIVVDDTMITNTVETDSAEAAGLFSLALVWHVLLTGILPSLAVAAVRLRNRPILREALVRGVFALTMLVVAVGAVGVQYKDFSLVLRQNRALRMFINPTYAIYSATEYLTQTAAAGNIPLKTIGTDATRTVAAQSRTARKVMILVVGETTRAANWGLDGYKRQTTPELAARDVINFSDAHSCGTSTAVSVPCMFSPLPRDDYDEYDARHSENLLDVLSHAGVNVRWEDNQAGGCKGVCARVPTTDMRRMDIDGVCGGGTCHDAVFVHGLKDRIANGSDDLVIVMHTMGSHGPAYYKRYPEAFQRYTPECRSNRPQECSSAQLTNSYDNTVRYTDHVLALLIDVLKTSDRNTDTALLYLSDHGESLGENGLYLHGFPYMIAPDEQTRIPMVAWFSDGFARASGLDRSCLKNAARKRVSQDNLFDSVLGLMDVDADIYDRSADILAGCRSNRALAGNGTRTSG